MNSAPEVWAYFFEISEADHGADVKRFVADLKDGGLARHHVKPEKMSGLFRWRLWFHNAEHYTTVLNTVRSYGMRPLTGRGAPDFTPP